MEFATCDVNNALKFLGKDLQAKDYPKLCKALQADIVRVTDPQFHALALVHGKNCANAVKGQIVGIVEEIKNLL